MKDQIRYYENKLKYELDVWDLFRALCSDREVVVIDTRPVESFVNEHIPQAINMPALGISADSTRHFSRGALYVTYCDGVGGNSATEGALKLVKLGFDVRELMGGLEWWQRARYATAGVDSKAGQEVY